MRIVEGVTIRYLWQRFKCTVPMSTRTLTSTARRHNEGVIKWNIILRNLASRNAGRVILMDIDYELNADQTDHRWDLFDSIEGQAWMNRVFQERLDEMEVELLGTGVLKKRRNDERAGNLKICAH